MRSLFLIPFRDKVVNGGMTWREGHSRAHETAAPLGAVGNDRHPDLVGFISFLPIEFPARFDSCLRYGFGIQLCFVWLMG